MEICKWTACETADKIKKGEVSVQEVTKAYIQRIEALDSKVESYITVCADQAMARAEAIQKKISSKESVSPAAGLPIKSHGLSLTRGNIWDSCC